MTKHQLAVMVPAPLTIGSSAEITMELTNQSPESVQVVAGSSVLTVGLADLLDGVGPGITLTPTTDAWSASLDQSAARLVLTAASDDSIPAGGQRQIGLEGIALAAPTRIVTLMVTPSGMDVDPAPQAVPVVVQATPPGLTLPVSTRVAPIDIPVQPADGPTPPIMSSITLTLSHPGVPGHDKPLVPKDKQHGSHPQFQLTPIYASTGGAGALTSPQDAATYGLSARTGQVYQHPWQIQLVATSPPIWSLSPNWPGVLGPNDAVEIVIEEIVTHLEVGTTNIYLQYAGIPGYADGYVTFPVTKVLPSPGMVDLHVLPPAGRPIPGERTLDLAWSSYLGQGEWLELTFNENGAPRKLTSRDAKDPLPLQATSFRASSWLLESTDVTLTAYNGDNYMNSQSQPVDMQAAPRVTNFAASPLVGMEQPVNLTWDLTAAKSCTVTIDGFPGSVDVPVSGDGPVTTSLTLHSDPQGAVASIGDHGSIPLHQDTPPETLTVWVNATTPQEGTDVPATPLPQTIAVAPAVGPLTVTVTWQGNDGTSVVLTWSAPNASYTSVMWDVYVEVDLGVSAAGPMALYPPTGGQTTISGSDFIETVIVTTAAGWGPGPAPFQQNFKMDAQRQKAQPME